MSFWLHEAAEAELDAAAAYYENTRPRLEINFAEEVYSAIAVACAYLKAGLVFTEIARRRLVKRFPFAIIYQPRSNGLYVIAVADLRRKPGHGKGGDMSPGCAVLRALAGIPRVALLMRLADYRVSPFGLTLAELAEDAENA